MQSRLAEPAMRNTLEMTSTVPLTHSRDSFSLRPGVYVAACQSAPLQATRDLPRGGLSYSR